MFGSNPPSTLPIVEVSIDGSLDPKKNWALGEAIAELRCVICLPLIAIDADLTNRANSVPLSREEGYLIISGGLTVHTFENNLGAFHPHTARPIIKEFDNAVIEAAGIQDVGVTCSFHNASCNQIA